MLQTIAQCSCAMKRATGMREDRVSSAVSMTWTMCVERWLGSKIKEDWKVMFTS